MKKICIEISDDKLDSIVFEELKSALHNLADDCVRRQNDEGIAIFEVDKEKDLVIIKEHIRALETVLEYYGEKL